MENKQNIKIRKATFTDLPKIIDLWGALTDFHAKRDPIFAPSPDALEKAHLYISELLKDYENTLVLVVVPKSPQKNGYGIIGYCIGKIGHYPPVFVIDKVGGINDLYVKEEYRRMDIGKKLVQETLDWFRLKEITRIEVGVSLTNELSQRFWEKMGFKDFRKVSFLTL